MVREAREEADRTIASAEARVRQIGIDTDALWQERLRLIEDAQAVAVSLAALAEEAAGRFPAWEPEDDERAVASAEAGFVAVEPVEEEPVDEEPVVEQPTEAFDVAEMLAEEEAAVDDRPLPESLNDLDLEPPPEFGEPQD